MDVMNQHNGSPTDTRHMAGLLKRWTDGDKDCLRQIFPLVYEQLERRAAYSLRGERHCSMEPGDLLSETYSRLHHSSNMRFHSTKQFIAFAAETMHRILVEKARARNTRKRGEGSRPLSLDGLENLACRRSAPDMDIRLAMKQAINRLRCTDERKAGMVEQVFIQGMKAQELGHVYNLTPASIRREIREARKWLAGELGSYA